MHMGARQRNGRGRGRSASAGEPSGPRAGASCWVVPAAALVEPVAGAPLELLAAMPTARAVKATPAPAKQAAGALMLLGHGAGCAGESGLPPGSRHISSLVATTAAMAAERSAAAAAAAAAAFPALA